MKGIAPIKKEFLKEVLEKRSDELTRDTPVVKDGKSGKRSADEVNSEDSSKRKKRRGQNKARDKFSSKRDAPEFRMCKAILCERECSYGAVCKFSHDIQQFMSKKPVDIGDSCYNFSQLGRCPYSYACRFAKSHVKEDNGTFTNVVDSSVVPKSFTSNQLTSANLTLLRKHKYDFSKADSATKNAKNLVADIVKNNLEKNCTKKNKNGEEAVAVEEPSAAPDESKPELVSEPKISPKDETLDGGTDINSDIKSEQEENNKPTSLTVVKKEVVDKDDTVKPVGPITNEDEFCIKPGEKKTIDFANKLYLAPLTTVGNLPFRRVCKTFGADITCGEMALATKLLQGVSSEWALVKRHSSEDVFGVQLCGAFPDSMSKCTQLLNETCNLDFIDINVGCPIDLVFDQGAGSALMRRANRFHEIVDSMVSVSTIPITAKIRTGISESKNTAHSLLTKMKSWGLAMTTIHGRSREQRYTRCADWQYISQCAEAALPMPLYGGGDILSFEDYNQDMETGVTGTMIARGALVKPWIFTEIKEQRHWDISSNERLDIMRDFTNYGLEHWGSDQQGVETTRRFLLEWLSFLHRYIPVGLMERLPQKINERPPPYQGRDDLETLMASPVSSDWVKISEMLLGPIPEGFFFIPKHRANAYS